MKARHSAAGAGEAARHNAEINVTPFVDIMLVLLIIFMVAAPMATVSMKLDLPPAERPKAPVRDPVYVTVQADGSVFVGDRASSPGALPADVCAALGGGDCRRQRIFVRAEPETSYARFMAVMNTLYGNGFTQVGLLNEDLT